MLQCQTKHMLRMRRISTSTGEVTRTVLYEAGNMDHPKVNPHFYSRPSRYAWFNGAAGPPAVAGASGPPQVRCLSWHLSGFHLCQRMRRCARTRWSCNSCRLSCTGAAMMYMLIMVDMRCGQSARVFPRRRSRL